MQRSKIVCDCDLEMVIFFIPYSNVVYKQVYKQSTEIIILNIASLELFQPVNDLFFIQIDNGLFFLLEFSFKGFLVFLQFHHTFYQRFRGKAAFNSLDDIIKGHFRFMEPTLNGWNVGGSLYILKVGADCHFCNLLYIFIREQGKCVTDNNILYKVLT